MKNESNLPQKTSIKKTSEKKTTIILWISITIFLGSLFLLLYSNFSIDERAQLVPPEILKEETIFIDKSYEKKNGKGSTRKPFTEIQKGIDAAKEQNKKTLFIFSGNYQETLFINNDLKIVGQNKEGTTIVGPTVEPKTETETATITLDSNSNLELHNLQLTKGKHVVKIPEDISANLVINNCTISGASKFGIYNRSENPETKIQISNSLITKNRSQGIYLKKCSFFINDSEVVENGEEGIDFHAGVRAEVKNTIISRNGEGGIETELGDVQILIESCTIENNVKSGINIQSYKRNSNITITKNTIKNNGGYGVRCALHSQFKSPYFKEMVKIEEDNTIIENKKVVKGEIRNIDKNCWKR